MRSSRTGHDDYGTIDCLCRCDIYHFSGLYIIDSVVCTHQVYLLLQASDIVVQHADEFNNQTVNNGNVSDHPENVKASSSPEKHR